MHDSIVTLIATAIFGPGASTEIAAAAAVAIACAIVLFAVAVPFASVVTWVERRVWARIQSRIGPNRVGPNGFLQWLADGVKHVCKEDVIPEEADARLFKLAPYLVVLAFILPWAVMPFSSALILADLNIGILYMTAITALTVVGVLMAGWASNNKWSLIGGIRSAAQIISYEIPAGLSIFPVVLMTGTLSMQGIIRAQEWEPYHWFIFANPFCFAAAIILFVSSLAENNRTPFDLPEAESELVAGFATEYSSMRYLFFFMAEWGNMFVAAAIIVTLYLGGWQIPYVTDNPAVANTLQFVSFMVKVLILVFVSMWIRGTLPRVRIDQMMSLCWKYFVPISFIDMIGTAVWVAFFPRGNRAMQWAMLLFGVGVVVLFAWRVIHFTRRSRMELYFHPTI
ncbi:MAG TPA: NADH-quinone oxidoreductase subunit NuoH [Candidatus Binataceae bacterium]|jgi:NADH-quinone oxidoreductase subunit H|nr:NADH-quinone oxidoreductase subunit NuoH [Candidatus Binataceae bacterium]